MAKALRTLSIIGALLVTPHGRSDPQNPWAEMHAKEHKALAQTLEKELIKRSQEARTFAANTVLTTNNPPRISQVLTSNQKLSEQVDQLTFHDANGLLLGASAGADTHHGHTLWREDPWYAAVQTQRHDSFLASHLEDGSLVFYLAAWNRLDQWMGILTVRMNLHWLDEVLQSFARRYAFAAMDGYRLSVLSQSAAIRVQEHGTLNAPQQLETTLDTQALKGDWQWQLRTQIEPPPTVALKAQVAPSPTAAPAPAESSLWPWIASGCLAFFSASLSILWFRQKNQNADLALSLQKFQTRLRQKNQKLAEQDRRLKTTRDKILQLNRSFQERRPGFHTWMAECARTDEHVQGLLRRCSEQTEQLQRIRTTGLQALETLERNFPAKAAQATNSSVRAYQLVTEVMQDIEQKTKVIHEIVFQTKLLSFNASVEAARAGEHGRGFAIVAEEVGNLAAMSGTAAKDIARLLQDSLGKIQNLQNEVDEPDTAQPPATAESRERWARVLQDLDVFIKDFELHRYDVDRLQVFGRQTIESMRVWGEFMAETEQRLKAGQAA